MNRKTRRSEESWDYSTGKVNYRLGTTSYIQPDAILPNVRWLMGKTQDIELVLFEVDDGPSNLPSPEEIQSLANMARISDFTYTVHLPLDLDCCPAEPEGNISLEKARKVIERTMPLEPEAYIVHLDGKDLHGQANPQNMKTWTANACRTLAIIASWAGSYEKLAVENLEGYPPDQLDGVLAQVPVSRCVDIGHLWLDGHDPRPLLEKFLPRTRVIHLHGVNKGSASTPGRTFADHQSLVHTPPQDLQSVIDALSIHHFHGVVTLEVFNESDFLTSKERVTQCQRK
ncbi:MAG: cobamide remodeling phosphodiesterase CbiR [Anaerolineaceae bacterium]